MFYQSVKTAFEAGLLALDHDDRFTIQTSGIIRLKASFLTRTERQKLVELIKDEFLQTLKGSDQKCSECEGAGAIRFVGQEPNTPDLRCPWCDGDGKVFVEVDE